MALFASDFFRRRLLELLGLGILAASGVLAAALITFHPADPSFNRATTAIPENIIGVPGAYIADILLQTFGIGAALLILAPLFWGFLLIRDKEIPQLGLRIVMLLTASTALSGFLAALDAPVSWPIASGMGGFLGMMLHTQVAPLVTELGFIASTLLLGIATFGLSLGLSTPTLWYAALDTGSWAAERAQDLLWAIRDRMPSLSRNDTEEDEEEWEDEEEEDIEEDEEDAELEEDGEEEDLEDEERPGLLERMTGWLPFRSRQSDADEEEGGDYEEDEEDADAELEEDDEEEEEPDVAEVAPPAKKAKPKRRFGRGRSKQQSLGLPSQAGYRLPPIKLLKANKAKGKNRMSVSARNQNARMLESVLEDFGVQGEIVKVHPGPVVTLYELEPAPGTKSSRVIGLSDDIARSMSAVSARIAVIPGRNALGIELPNATRETVYLRNLLETDDFRENAHSLPLALGKNIGGKPIAVDLAKMPHLLVAGTTGSGKSVAINAMILSLLYQHSPDECKFIMIDPKMLELSVYDGIPHLLSPVVTEPGKAVVALKWTVKEMENRYRLMANLGVRNVAGYNKRIEEARRHGEQLTRQVQTGFNPDTGEPIIEEQDLDMAPLPFIVVVVDEMADLMLVAGKDIEASVQRLAQMARAAGIHIIMATQRPSVDVITGVIKANFPTRISFQVTSRIDSRTILGEQGAEQLLGMGDMLYMAGGGRITRIHGPFVSDHEVEDIVAFWRDQGEPEYLAEVTEGGEDSEFDKMLKGDDKDADLYDRAVAIVQQDRKASTSYLQRRLKIGYNRAADLIDRMEQEGVISQANHAGKREVLTGGNL